MYTARGTWDSTNEVTQRVRGRLHPLQVPCYRQSRKLSGSISLLYLRIEEAISLSAPAGVKL